MTLSTHASAELIITDFDITVNAPNDSVQIDINGAAPGGEITVEIFSSDGGEGGDLFELGSVFSTDENAGISFSNSLDGGEGLFLNKISSGNIVDAASFMGVNSADEGGFAYAEDFFTPGLQGEWAQLGAHGYVGIRYDNGTDFNYGWLELTRGSLIISQSGFQTTGGVGAQIPQGVPEPMPMALLASGVFGLLATRRRYKVTREK